MTEKPLVSVIINCFNGEKYLREAIDSVMAQTYENWELVFWDNQSTDSTPVIISSYNDTRIKYYKAEEHTSLGEARNVAMRKATGQLCGFLDSDDIWGGDFLEECVFAFENHHYTISAVYTNYLCFNSTKEHNASKREEGIVNFGDLLIGYDIGMSACVFRRELCAQKNISFDKRFSLIEDFDFFLTLAHIAPIYYLETVLVKYRMHEDSLTVTHKKGWGKELIILYDKLVARGVDKQYPKQVQWIQVRAINANINDCIENNEKGKVWELIRDNWRKSWKLCFPVIFLLTGKSFYKRFYSSLRKKDYNA